MTETPAPMPSPLKPDQARQLRVWSVETALGLISMGARSEAPVLAEVIALATDLETFVREAPGVEPASPLRGNLGANRA